MHIVAGSVGRCLSCSKARSVGSLFNFALNLCVDGSQERTLWANRSESGLEAAARRLHRCIDRGQSPSASARNSETSHDAVVGSTFGRRAANWDRPGCKPPIGMGLLI